MLYSIEATWLPIVYGIDEKGEVDNGSEVLKKVSVQILILTVTFFGKVV